MLAAIALLLPQLATVALPTPVPFYAWSGPALQQTCKRSGGSSSNTHESRDGEIIRWRAFWSGDDCSIDLRSTGDLRFNADFTDIVSISSGGSFEITETQGSTARRLTIRSEGSGRTSRIFAVNGQQRPWDADAARWFADLLIELDRMTAVGVDYRYPTLFGRGGASAVIAEAEKMYGDYARSVYLRRLVDSASLSNAEYERVVAVASRDMTSDYEMSRILRSVAEKSPLDNDAMRRSYLAAVGRMTSDYERSRVLQTIVAKSPTSHEVGAAAVRAAANFTSDYERGRVLLAAIANKSLTIEDVIPILETVSKSTSDYEKSRVLLAVAGRWAVTGDARKAYLRAADTIRSDYENRRVLAALINQEPR